MRSSGSAATLWVIGAAVVLTACSGLVDPEGERRPGVIAFYADPVVIDVPDTVRSGVAFAVSVPTYGGGCLTEGGTDVHANRLGANVFPYDVHSGADVCTEELRLFDHRATVTLTGRGAGEIRFHGWELPADSSLTVTRSVVVQ